VSGNQGKKEEVIHYPIKLATDEKLTLFCFNKCLSKCCKSSSDQSSKRYMLDQLYESGVDRLETELQMDKLVRTIR
jgi:hypothetical protein